MPRSALTGTRIRERRLAVRRSQAGVARAAGVSPAYLNLIEHNRRRVGTELLARLAEVLGVPAAALDEEGESALLVALREAAAALPGEPHPDAEPEPEPEIERIEEFASRFPGWAGRLAERQGRVQALERLAEALSERLTHDPYLSAALHEVLTVVTSIRSTAAILVEGGEISPDLQARFHGNIHDDSLRLSGAAAELVRYLDRSDDAAPVPALPLDELTSWLGRQGWHLAALEGPEAARPEDLVDEAGLRGPARDLALAHARQAAADAAMLPLAPFIELARAEATDPGRMAARFDLPLPAVMRRLAALPDSAGLPSMGLAVCDGAGVLTFRKPLPGFALPRLGGTCPLWPLYEALSDPGRPLRRTVEIAAREPRRFVTDAHCALRHPQGAEGPQVATAMMLFRPAPAGPAPRDMVAAGLACRICPRGGCLARREPSVLGAAPARSVLTGA